MNGTVKVASQPSLILDVQYASELQSDDLDDAEEPPAAQQLQQWAQCAYAKVGQVDSDATLRIVGAAEMQALNRQFRDQDKTTNVLAFPFDIDPDVDISLLGDVVICHPLCAEEAVQQSKPLAAHYAHLVTHGILHLCGFDHQHAREAETMESLEVEILTAQGFADPYRH
ncbi:MAG: rRNA maturation RNase YbeY [Gammaproteobacteria bacterium]|nr:rRNA maturation RNase YbeY [Gammaproteobacteria bacterium]